MAHQHPANTGQEGIYYTASGGYIDVDGSFSALSSDFKTFADEALAKIWADGDTVDIRIQGVAGQWELWRAAWDETNEHLAVSTIIEVKGTAISNGAAVDVSCVVTGKLIEELTAPSGDAEWTKVSDYDFSGVTFNDLKRPTGLSWSDVKIVFRGITGATTSTRPWVRGLLDDVYMNANIYQWQIMSQRGAGGLFYQVRNSFTYVQLVYHSHYGVNNFCGEMFFFDAESQNYVSFMALIKYEETAGNMVTAHLFGNITTTGKDLTGIRVGLSGGTATGGLTLYYKQ